MTNSEIDKFFTTVAGFEQVVITGEKDREHALQSQRKLLANLNEKLKKLPSDSGKLDSLKHEIDAVISGITKSINQIEQSTKEMEHRIRLQLEYQERLIILVFGKVNAGKSSFSNYLVELFKNHLSNPLIHYFYFDEGIKKALNEPFKEGSTETTARIQGVELGKIILLDTPGLHSITQENGDLTKQYTDSADLILWLSGSNSPGQTQELNELRNEIDKGKVLFPIITKSDIKEEDIDVDENGDEVLVSKLLMKPIETQKMQCDDVHSRAKDKLREFNSNLDKLKQPISLSVYYAKEYSDQEDILVTSGIDSLFRGLNGIYDEIIESKKNNVSSQVKNHLKHVATHLSNHIEVPFKKLREDLHTQRKEIQSKTESINITVLNSVTMQVPSIVSKHSQNKNIKAVLKEVNQLMTDEINTQLEIVFQSVFESLLKSVTIPRDTVMNLDANFEDETYSYTYQQGNSKKAATAGVGSAGGAWAGAEIGTMILPGVGTVVGGILGGIFGGMAGNKAGDYFIETKTIENVIGVDSSKLESELNMKLQNTIPKFVSHSIDSLVMQFKPLENVIEQSLQEIQQFKKQGEIL
jgi:tRNA U34 5-carboxymethylaminomethyl modifying GTPase MnmE/TrmE